MFKARSRRIAATFGLMIALLAVSFGFSAAVNPTIHTSAAPVPKGADYRILAQDGSSRKTVYLASTAISATGTGSSICGLGNFDLHSAQLTLSGTPAGTNPVFTFTWQHSIDGGTTWYTVDTFTAINATVTPAAQLKTVSDVKNASTAVAYGDCFRVSYVVSGTNPSATFQVVGYDQD